MTSTMYTTTIDYGNVTNTPYTTSSAISTNNIEINNDVIIKRPGKSDIHVAKTLEVLMDRLSVIEPKIELIEKYPALHEAYENYKLIEALLINEDNETSKKV